jgi:phytol kinase
MRSDLVALLASYAYVFGVLLVGEVLGRFVLKRSTAFTRKFVHVGVGMWVVGTVLLFQSWQAAIIPPLTFIIINYISYRQDLFKGMEQSDKRNLGTVYFPISFAIVIALCWAKPSVVLAGLMPMTWGDALAAVIGQRWGRHRLSVQARGKSWEGTATMFVASFLSVLLALLALGTGGTLAAVCALITAAVASLVEAVTPWGVDNLTVPLVSAGLLWLLIA